MKRILSVLVVAGAVVVAACSERDGASRPLGLTAATDSSTDSIPGRKPGPVASVTVSPESATVNVGDSAGFFADLRDAAGIPARDANVKWSVADPTRGAHRGSLRAVGHPAGPHARRHDSHRHESWEERHGAARGRFVATASAAPAPTASTTR